MESDDRVGAPARRPLQSVKCYSKSKKNGEKKKGKENK